MLPPVRLKTRSRSGGASTWRSRTALEVRRVLVEQVEAAVRERLTVVVPGSVASSYGAYCTNIDIRWRPGGATVGSTAEGIVHSSTGSAEGARLGVVERALDVVLVGADVDRAAMLRAWLGARQRSEVRQLGQGDVDLQRGAGVADPLDVGHERLQRAPVEQAKEGHVGVGVASATTGRNSSPLASATPTAFRRERGSADLLVVRPAPRSRADASACVPAPPPRTYAHTPRAPPLSPMTWWKSTYAVPGIEGLAIAPMTASVASVPFSSDSNQRSRIGRAAPVRISTASLAAVSQPPKRTSQREHRPEVAWARVQQVGRSHRQRRLDHRRHAFEHRLVLRVALGVAR